MKSTIAKSSEHLTPNESLLTPAIAFDALNVGNTKGWKLIADGLLEVVYLGPRCPRVRLSSVNRLAVFGVPQTKSQTKKPCAQSAETSESSKTGGNHA